MAWPSLIDRLPVEIIANCFLLTLGERVPALRLKEPPLIFLLVCRRWRDIALSTPCLWSRVLVQADKIKPDDSAKVLSAFDAWLSRSGTLPLSCHVKDYRGQRRIQDKFFSIILRYATRLQDLHFICVNAPTFSDMPLFPLLKTASLLYCRPVTSKRKDCVVLEKTIENAPILDSLALEFHGFEDYPAIYYNRLKKIRIVETLEFMKLDDAHRLAHRLHKFSNLEVLAIESMGGDIYSDGPGNTHFLEPVELPRLARLFIRAENTELFPIILHKLFSPVLESISIDAPLGGESSTATLARLFAAHRSSFRSLTYHFTFSLDELKGRSKGTSSDEWILSNPKVAYQRKCHLDWSLWASASSVESFTLCDHTDASISFLECLIALIIHFHPKDPARLMDGGSYMPCLWDFTIQIRPIREEWYLQRLATVLHNILSSRAQLRGMLEAGMLEELMESSKREAFLRRRPRLRVVFIVEPSDVSRYAKNSRDTEVDVREVSDVFDPYECIEHCTAVIREKLEAFVSRPRPGCVDREQCLDLEFVVVKEEGCLCSGEEELERPYDVRFMPTRTTVNR